MGLPQITVFDRGPRGTLATTFTRNVTTIDEQLAVRAANEMRQSRDTAVCERPDWVSKATLNTATWSILGSGEDHDGVTPIAVLYNQSVPSLRIIRGTGYTTVRNIDVASSGGRIDLLKTYANVKPYHTHRPVCVSIVEGCIIVGCEVTHEQTDGTGVANWQKQYEAFLYSNDLGVTWSFVQTTAGADYPTPTPGSLGNTRLNTWALMNYFPSPWNASPMLSAWLCPVDYESQSPSHGGQGYLFRITRPAVGQNWVVEPLRTITGIYASVRHCHGAGVVQHGSTLHYVAVYGDSGQNEIVRYTCNDPANYATAVWTEQRAFHGSTADYPDRRTIQPAGIAPGPDGVSLLGASDIDYGAVQQIIVPVDTSAKATTKVLAGAMMDGQIGQEVLHIHARRPHVCGGYVSHQRPQSGATFPHMQGPIYSADGLNWAELRNNLSAGCFFYGDDIISVRNGAPSDLYGCARPRTWHVRRAAAVAPGGTNYIYSGPAGGTYNARTMTLCPQDGQGRYLWPVGSALAGQLIDPQPPTRGLVWHVADITDATADTTIFEWLWGTSSVPTQLGAGRVWMMAVGAQKPLPGIRWARQGLTFGEGEAYSSVAANAQWLPFPRAKDYGITNWKPEFIGSTGSVKQRCEFLFAVDVLTSGGHIPYPIPLNTTGAHEKLAVTGLGCGAQWTVAVMAQVPMDSWDQWTNGLVMASWPLFTIWGNATNYVEFSLVKGASADAVGTLRATVVSGGVSAGTIDIASVWASRGSMIAVVLSQGAGSLALSAIVAGPPVATGTLAATLAVNPTQVRFGNNDQSTVVGLCPVSVACDAAASRDAAERAALLTGTELLRTPIRQSNWALGIDLGL